MRKDNNSYVYVTTFSRSKKNNFFFFYDNRRVFGTGSPIYTENCILLFMFIKKTEQAVCLYLIVQTDINSASVTWF